MENENSGITKKTFDYNYPNYELSKSKVNEMHRYKNTNKEKLINPKENENNAFYNHNQPPKTSYSNKGWGNCKDSVPFNHIKIIESSPKGSIIESMMSRFTINPEVYKFGNPPSGFKMKSKEENQMRMKYSKKSIPDESNKMIQEHIMEYRKIHNKLIDNQLNNFTNQHFNPNPKFNISNKKQLMDPNPEDFRPMTTAFPSNIIMPNKGIDSIIEKPKSALQGKRIFNNNSGIDEINKHRRPESRYKKESLCIPLMKDREKSPDYKVPIEKMNYEAYKQQNAVLPSCWD